MKHKSILIGFLVLSCILNASIGTTPTRAAPTISGVTAGECAAGSPVIDSGDNDDCPATDQRGVARPLDGDHDGIAMCDIAAIELDGPINSITIIKETDPDGGSGFNFAGDLGTFTLDDDERRAFENLSPGDYTVTETLPAGWGLTGVACTGGDSDPIAGGVTIHLDPGENIACTFTNDLLPTIALTKSADPTSVDEPGGTVAFTVRIDNTSPETVTLTALTDDIHGNLAGQGACSVPQEIGAGDFYTCTFSAVVSGNPGYSETDTVTAIAEDDAGHIATDDDQATVTIADLPSSILVAKTANPTKVVEPGGEVTYTVVVENTSLVDSVTIETVTDDLYGDVSAGCAPSLPAILAPGASLTCRFTAFVSGDPGDVVTDIVTVTGLDDDGQPVSGSDDAAVTIEELTAVTLLSFTAEAGADHITLAWETGTEVDNAGFNLWRGEAADSPYTQLNDALIPAQGDPVSGASYVYTDADVVKGVTYYFKLEDVDIHGVRAFHGPVSATPGQIRWIYLPFVLK